MSTTTKGVAILLGLLVGVGCGPPPIRTYQYETTPCPIERVGQENFDMGGAAITKKELHRYVYYGLEKKK